MPNSTSTKGFGKRFAILSIDLMNTLINGIQEAPRAAEFIGSTQAWLDAVHELDPQPLSIFTSLAFVKPSYPELPQGTAFANLVRGSSNFTDGGAEVQIDSRFDVTARDILLHKTRWYAGAGNSLEQILSAQQIDTVILVSW